MKKFFRPRLPGPPRWLPPLLLAALLGLGLLLFPGYGLTWDEPSNHYNGAANLGFVAERLLSPALLRRLTPATVPPTPAVWDGCEHGVAFELPAALLGRLLYPGNPRGYYILRHLLIFLTFVGGLVLLYQLAQLRYPSGGWLPLLAPALLVGSPRFFAEAFYNGKDIVFLVAFTGAMLTLAQLLRRPTVGRALWHALAVALAADVRLAGLPLLGAFTAAGLLAQPWLGGARPVPAGRRLALGALAGTGALLGLLLGWPYLWADPVGRLRTLLFESSFLDRDGIVLYAGEFVKINALPWHYHPTWIGITTPVPYLLLAGLGAGTGAVLLVRHGRGALARPGAWLDALFMAWLLGPLLLVVATRAVVYDGWRHVYFVYPALLLLALRGARALRAAWATAGPRARPWLGAVLGLGAFEVGRTLWFIGAAYPNQQVYFSCLPAATAERLFERDYWGGSYRYGLEWLLAHDPAPTLHVAAPRLGLLYINYLLLKPAEQRRLVLENDPRRAQYFVSAYRYHPQSYADSLGPEILLYRPGGGIKALSVFRRPPGPAAGR